MKPNVSARRLALFIAGATVLVFGLLLLFWERPNPTVAGEHSDKATLCVIQPVAGCDCRTLTLIS